MSESTTTRYRSSAGASKPLASDPDTLDKPESMEAIILPTKTAIRRYGLSLRSAVLVLLPLLSVAAVYCLWIIAIKNGLFKQLGEVIKHEEPKYPGSEEPLVLQYTKIAAVDHQLATLVAFFAPVVEGAHMPLGLFSLFGLGQFSGVWALLVLESLRKRHEGRAVSYIGVYGFLVQNVSFALATPLYLFMHLLTSPLAKPFPSTHASNVSLVTAYDMVILPFSIVLGLIVPSLLMMFPGSSTPFGSATHQAYIAFWQAFPIWTVLIHWTVRWLCTAVAGPSATKSNRPYSVPSNMSFSSSGLVYTFVLIFCVATHLPAVILSVISPEMISESMEELSHLAHSTFASVFIPPIPPTTAPIHDMAEGVHIFLQWDLYIGITACLLWGMVLYQNAATEKEIIDPSKSLPAYRQLLVGERPRGQKLWQKLPVKLVFWTIVAGPVGALTILLWERDAIVKQKLKQGI